jgi:hypothetical protein
MDVVPAALAERGPWGSTEGGAPRLVRRIASIFCLLVLVGSGSSACRQSRLLLDHAVESPEAVARAVLRALNTSDRSALETLSLTEHEFRKVVWPKLPASRPGRNIPWDYVWKDLHGKSVMQMQARLHEWQRDDATIVRVEFAGETTDYDTHRVKRKSVVVLKTAAGQEIRQRWFGSIIEQGGRYKVFSYVVD